MFAKVSLFVVPLKEEITCISGTREAGRIHSAATAV
jgi:hypothetical protein